MNKYWHCILSFLLIASPIQLCSDDATEKLIAEMMVEREAMNAIEAKSNALKEKIEAELATIGDHPWAGRYYQGDGLGANLSFTLAPESGFTYTWHGCLGLYAVNYGSITEKEGRLELTFAVEQEQGGMEGLAKSFTVVPWGERVYLIPSDEIIEFCNEINLGREPRNSTHGQVFLRQVSEQKPVTGNPSIPEEFKPYLLEEPIETSVTSIGEHTFRGRNADFQFKDTLVTLDKGREDGLLPGMEFFIDQSFGIHEDITIKEVGEKTSTGIISQSPGVFGQSPGVFGQSPGVFGQSPTDYHEIKVGWKFQSRAWFYQ